MIRRDYILDQLEQFANTVAKLFGLIDQADWEAAMAVSGEEFQRLLGIDAEAARQLSDTELLARPIQAGPGPLVAARVFMVATLFKASGDQLAGQQRVEESWLHYLRGLELLLVNVDLTAIGARPDFVPTIEAFQICLREAVLPPRTQLLLFRHYENNGEFAKAEDALFALVEDQSGDGALANLGEGFYQRVLQHSDEALLAGNLPRAEAEKGLADFRKKVA